MKYSDLEDKQGKSQRDPSSSVLCESDQIATGKRASATETRSTELRESEAGTEGVVIISWEGAFMVQRKKAPASQADS